MTAIKPGDRVSYKRRGCKRQYGTVVSIWSKTDLGAVEWVMIRWDEGGHCLWNPRTLRLVTPKKG